MERFTLMGTIETSAGAVSVALDGPQDAPLLVLAPGAGAPMTHEFMVAIAQGVTTRGIRVCRFNFAYQEAGKKGPDRQPVLEETYREVVAEVTRDHDGPLFLGGKSMGGRIASHIVASGTDAVGLVFHGYPLHPPGRPDRIRKDHLVDIKVPMLFVEGTRDPFCPLDTLDEVRAELVAETTVAVIGDGDHTFKVRKSSGRDTAAAWQEVVDATVTWIESNI
ncbi:MAG: alpha/beta hydrolase family protein [Actinomycetota bacterium]